MMEDQISNCLMKYKKEERVKIFTFIIQVNSLTGDKHLSLFSLFIHILSFMQKHHPKVYQQFSNSLKQSID